MFFTLGMNIEYQGRKCSAVNSDGHPCQAWAIRGSKPALCSVHAGRNSGGGAPMGNKNALKHGYYTRHFTEREIADFELLTERSLAGELVLARTMIGRLVAFVTRDGVTTEGISTAMPLIFSGLRTVAYLVKNIDEESVDWDVILDEVGKDWEVDL